MVVSSMGVEQTIRCLQALTVPYEDLKIAKLTYLDAKISKEEKNIAGKTSRTTISF